METCGQNVLPCGEGAKLGKTQQASGKKKTKKKKKKGTQDNGRGPPKTRRRLNQSPPPASPDIHCGEASHAAPAGFPALISLQAEKQTGKSKKQPAFLSSPELRSSPTTEDDASKEAAGRTAHRLFASTSNFSLSTGGHLDQSNESLRWNGILDDPVAEEERLWHYRLNRRKRYDAYIHQSLPPEPSLTLKRLPQLCKVAHRNGDHLFCKTEASTAGSQDSKT